MRLGVELVSLTELSIPAGSHFELRATLNGILVQNTAGRDEYRTAVTIAPGQRFAATGRLNLWDSEIVPAYALRVRPAYLMKMPIRMRDRLGFVLRGSVVLAQGQFQSCVTARISTEAPRSRAEIPLSRPTVTVDWEGRGRFKVDLGEWPLVPRKKGGESR